MVAKELIEDIRSRINLVHIVEQVLPLKKSGRSFSGLCPFHQEKTPSFTVSEDKQLYHCFGCGAGGTVYNFFMDYYHLSFPEALERASTLAGIDISNDDDEASKTFRKAKEKRHKLLGIMELTASAYHKSLLSSPNAEHARAYLADRGFGKDIVRHFELGYAPNTWDSIVKYLRSKDVNLENAAQIGLVSKSKTGRQIDFFRNRLIFPIKNPDGKVIGFGGRVLGNEHPKYLNSPQSLIFDKGKWLFGLYEAESDIRREKAVFVTEGYTDQIALYQAGIKNVVATLGTALTLDHAKVLKRYADKITLVFDGDNAGLRAIIKAMKPLLSEGLSTSVCALPQGYDPDSYIKAYGTDAFRILASKALPLVRYFIETYYLSEPDIAKKTLAIKEIIEVIQSSHLYLKEALVREITDYAGLDEAMLRGKKKVKLDRNFQGNQKKSLNPTVDKSDDFLNEELILLRLCVEFEDAREQLIRENIFEYFSSDLLGRKAKEWLAQVDRDKIQPENKGLLFLDQWEDEGTRGQIRKIFLTPSLDFGDDWKKAWHDCLTKIKKRKIAALSRDVEVAEGSGDIAQVRVLSLKILDLKKALTKHRNLLSDIEI